MPSPPRRDVLRVSSTLFSVGLAGCLSDTNERTMTDDSKSNPTDDSESNPTENDGDSNSIDGRLRNEDDAEQVFHVTIADESGSSRDGTFEVGPNSSTRIPAVGAPGDVLTVQVTVADTEVSETLELGGEASPGELAGFLTVVYYSDGEIEVSFEPTE